MKKLRVLVCGNSENDYPRDITIMKGLGQISDIEVIDLRVVQKK